MTPVQRAWRGGRNDWRLYLLSVFSVAVAFVCLASAVLVLVNVDGVRQRWSSTGRASVYLKPGATQPEVASLEKALRQTDGVTKVRHVSSEEAQRDLTDSTEDDVINALPSEAFPASLEIELRDEAARERVAKMSEQLKALPAVDAVETYKAWSERLTSLLEAGVLAAALLALIVLAAVTSVVSSTIRLALERRRVEVEILKLVGASDSYVRRPFVLEGAAQGGGGALLAVVLLGALYGLVRYHFEGSLGLLLGITPTFLPWTATFALIALGAGLGATAAYASLRRLLSV